MKTVITREEWEKLPAWEQQNYEVRFTHQYLTGNRYHWISRDQVMKDIFCAPYLSSLFAEVKEGWV